jgi:hypothetical protein
MAQMVACLSHKCEALISNPSTIATKKKKKKKKKKKNNNMEFQTR